MGLFGTCKDCKKNASEQIITPTLPADLQISYRCRVSPAPQKPQLIKFTPRTLDESLYILEDHESSIKSGKKFHVTIGGIDWIILNVQGSKILLITDRVIDNRPYHQLGNYTTWEFCSLRQYLNNDFYNKLGAVKAVVTETRNYNPNNLWHGISGGNSTTDKIFLLNLDEVCCYFGDSTANYKRKGSTGSNHYLTDGNDAIRRAKDVSGKAYWWWLRSPGSYSSYAAYIDGKGSVFVSGNDVGRDSGGVRPAMWINL